MQKYLGLFRNYFSVSLEYRSNIVGLVIHELVSMGVIVTLWLAVYKTEESIGGYSMSQTILYYILVPFVGFITAVKLSDRLGREIKDGLLSSYLMKPYHLWIVSFIRTSADKMYTLLILIPIYLVILFFVLGVFQQELVTWPALVWGMVMALCAYVLHFFLDFGIAGLAFWTDDVWSFKHFKSIVFGLLGGVSFPFEFLPENLRAILEQLPFKYLYYVPLSYITGGRAVDALTQDIVVLGFWVVVTILFAGIVWRRGVNKYGAYGG
jgi:ABC-2 type transport system permease protein